MGNARRGSGPFEIPLAPCTPQQKGHSEVDGKENKGTLVIPSAVQNLDNRTKGLESLFMYFRKQTLAQRVSSSTICRWVKGCIILAYQASSLEGPQGITAWSLRGAATSMAYRVFPSLEMICKAATWKSVHSSSDIIEYSNGPQLRQHLEGDDYSTPCCVDTSFMTLPRLFMSQP